MSYDLCCWKPLSKQHSSPQAIYESLLQEEEPAGLALLPVSQLREQFIQAFPSMDVFGTEMNLESANGLMQVSWPICSKPQQTYGLLINCSWGLLEEAAIADKLLQVVQALQCVLYDPQQNNLYVKPETWSA